MWLVIDVVEDGRWWCGGDEEREVETVCVSSVVGRSVIECDSCNQVL